MTMKPKIIRTEADCEAALARINVLMDGDPEPTSAAGEELELLCLLVGNYEAVHYPMDMPSPLEAPIGWKRSPGRKGWVVVHLREGEEFFVFWKKSARGRLECRTVSV